MQPAEVLDLIYLVLFVAGLAVSGVTITIRLAVHLKAGRRIPRLMPRDLALIIGLLLPFGAILTVRVFDIPVAGNLLWTAVTGAAAVGGVLVFAYYEVFVIGTGLRR